MNSSRKLVPVGLFRPLGHCLFVWSEPEPEGKRIVTVTSTHCPDCVAELEELGYLLARDGVVQKVKE